MILAQRTRIRRGLLLRLRRIEYGDAPSPVRGVQFTSNGVSGAAWWEHATSLRSRVGGLPVRDGRRHGPVAGLAKLTPNEPHGCDSRARTAVRDEMATEKLTILVGSNPATAHFNQTPIISNCVSGAARQRNGVAPISSTADSGKPEARLPLSLLTCASAGENPATAHLRAIGLGQTVIFSSRRLRHVRPVKAAKLADTRKDVLVAPELTGHSSRSPGGFTTSVIASAESTHRDDYQRPPVSLTTASRRDPAIPSPRPASNSCDLPNDPKHLDRCPLALNYAAPVSRVGSASCRGA